MTHRVFIVEDHPVMLQGYLSLLDIEPDVEVVGTAASAEEALSHIGDAAPDTTLVDLQLPGVNGIELVRLLRAGDLGGRLLVVSAHEADIYAERSREAGADGYLVKREVVHRLVDWIRAAA